MNKTESGKRVGPLSGYRVLELGSTIAGPFCGRLLADFGAEVIKVEPPTGDPVRLMGKSDGDDSLYARSILRNKRLISVDIKKDKGFKIVRDLMKEVDIVVENFRPGTMERLGLGYEEIAKDNPGLVMVRISGYGQTGQYKSRTGYGAICEAFAGVRHMTGEPDLPPSRVALSVTDQITAVYGAFGAMMALLNRVETGKGQVIDTALYEAAFSLMEPIVPAYDRLGIIPKRFGSKLHNNAPNSLYIAKDGDYILIAAINDATFRRLAVAMGQPELAEDPRYSTQLARKERIDEVDTLVGAWALKHNASDIEALLVEASVPTSRANTIEDIFKDPHFREREQLVEMPHEKFGTLTVAGIAPKLSETPGAIRELGGDLGRDNKSVMTEVLKMDAKEIQALEEQGILHSK